MRNGGLLALGTLAFAAVALIAVELAVGGWSYGSSATKDACRARASFSGGGVDATVQRVVQDGLYGAACRLGTTREELVLSLVPGAGETRRWDRKTIANAVRGGLVRALDEAQERGDVNALVAGLLRGAIERAPLDWLLGQGTALGNALSQQLQDLLGLGRG